LPSEWGYNLIELLELACNRHGGLGRWNAARTLTVPMVIGGALFEIKGFPEPLEATVQVDTRTPRSEFYPYPLAHERGVFTAKRVWIETREKRLLTESNNPRDTFAGHVRSTPWDQLQRLYFLGYAMWNYLCTPFLFNRPGFRCTELAPHEEQNESWRVLEVAYPPDFPAHCPVQKLYFDTSGVLKRLDYQTDIAGGVASHYCFDPKTFDGLLFYTRRRVVRRTAEIPDLSGPSTISLEFGSVVVSGWASFA
jgi:hypothetical protein